MPRITHIAIKVDSLDEACKLYENVFGFKRLMDEPSPGHVSRHLTDGAIVLSLLQYESEDSPEAMLAGRGPCIHHFGLEVDDPNAFRSALKDAGCEILTGSIAEFEGPKKEPIKFRTSHGIIAEILPMQAFNKPQSWQK
jgi:lactoylglutathione lyase